MQHRRFGSTDVTLSVVGLGTWAFGGAGWVASFGPQDDEESMRTIHASLEAGVSWIDTAQVYGLGHAERVVGRALRGRRRDEAFVATKSVERFDGDGRLFMGGTRAAVRTDLEASLRRLDLDHVDLLQIHGRPTDVPIEETWSAYAELAGEGKVRFVGTSNLSTDEVRRCDTIRTVDSVQPPYNLLDRGVEDDLLPYCRERGIAILAYSPLASGLLSGHFDASTLAEDDWRRADAAFAGRVPVAARLARALRPLLQELGLTLRELAVLWVLAAPGVTSAVVGARSPAHAEENAAIGSTTAPPDLRARVEDALRRHGS